MPLETPKTNGISSHAAGSLLPCIFVGFVLLLLFAGSGEVRSLSPGYEPSEANLTLSSRDSGMTVAWPVLGGVADVPNATEGSHVVKLPVGRRD